MANTDNEKSTVDLSKWNGSSSESKDIRWNNTVKELVQQALAKGLPNQGFVPMGDYDKEKTESYAGIANIEKWNTSLYNLYQVLNDPGKIISSSGRITINDIFGADAKGTESQNYLDPVPYLNKMNQSYVTARSDEMPMNDSNLDYTTGNGENRYSQNDINDLVPVMKYFDINGDGVIGMDDAAIIQKYMLCTDSTTKEEFLKERLSDIQLTPPIIESTSGADVRKYDTAYRTSYLPQVKNADNKYRYFLFSQNELTSSNVDYLYINPNRGLYSSFYGEQDIDSARELAIETLTQNKLASALATKNISGYAYDQQTGIAINRAIYSYSETRAYISYEEMAVFLLKEKAIKSIRLLMPQYARRVEVEDLDKNFWVIAQVLDALTEALFGTNGIFKSAKDMCEELSELWQGTAYIWNLLAQVVTLKQYDGDIDDIRKSIDIIKAMMGFGKVTSVAWGIGEDKTPMLNITNNTEFNKFSLHFENSYGKRVIDGIFDTNRIPVGSTLTRLKAALGENEGKLAIPHIGEGEDKTYDMFNAVQKFNTYANSEDLINQDITFPMCMLNTDVGNKNVMMQFIGARITNSTDADNQDYLSVFLNNNVENYFRYTENFSVVLYDCSYYDYVEEEVTTQNSNTGNIIKIKYKVSEDSQDSEASEDTTPEELAIYNMTNSDIDNKKIIIYLPRTTFVEGEIVRIDFEDFCAQEQTPKAVSGVASLQHKMDSYWGESRFQFWKTTFFKEGTRTTEENGVSKIIYELNNKITITYWNKNKDKDAHLIYDQPMDIVVYKTDLVDKYIESEFNETKIVNIENYPFRKLQVTPLFNIFENGLFKIFGTPGYSSQKVLGEYVGWKNYARNFIKGSLAGAGQINGGYVAAKKLEKVDGTEVSVVSVFDSFKDELKKAPETIYTALQFYGNQPPLNNSKNKYYPYSGIYIQPVGFSFQPDVHITMMRNAIENTCDSEGAAAANRIGIYGVTTNNTQNSSIFEKKLTTVKPITTSYKRVNGQMIAEDIEHNIGDNISRVYFIYEKMNMIVRNVAFSIETTFGDKAQHNWETDDPTKNGKGLYPKNESYFAYNYPRVPEIQCYGQIEAPCVARYGTAKTETEKYNTFTETITSGSTDIVNGTSSSGTSGGDSGGSSSSGTTVDSLLVSLYGSNVENTDTVCSITKSGNIRELHKATCKWATNIMNTTPDTPKTTASYDFYIMDKTLTYAQLKAKDTGRNYTHCETCNQSFLLD